MIFATIRQPIAFAICRVFCWLLLVGCFLCTNTSSAYADMRYMPYVNVFATSSLSVVMTEIIRAYAKEQDSTVSITYDAAAELLRKVEDGARADIFIADHPKWIKHLKQRGLVDVYTVATIAGDRLVAIASNKSALLKGGKKFGTIQKALRYAHNRAIFVIGDAHETSLGLYTKEALKNINFWERVAPLSIRAGSSANVLYLLMQGKNAGITYQTNALHNDEVTILSTFPEDVHEKIIYQAGVLAGENMTQARSFVTFLKSDVAKDIFLKHGFTM